ncbi:hypothetical protein [Alicyclobacillus shizuokensis]|uniref:hypothetical protein n=1 Tax=Alicyclobacillus shizuokensis TaxID=392014 RepID=UPI00082C8EE4|nr:hypothetical protein [Alicyclobacillus shizuokensis]
MKAVKMKQEVMKRAHELAKAMEGDYRARMVMALRQAWREARAPKFVVLRVNHQPSGGREWVARIMGRHPKYRFEREFLAEAAREWSGSGKTGITVYELSDGIYEVNEPWKGRRFVEVANGEVRILKAEEVLERVA